MVLRPRLARNTEDEHYRQHEWSQANPQCQLGSEQEALFYISLVAVAVYLLTGAEGDIYDTFPG